MTGTLHKDSTRKMLYLPGFASCGDSNKTRLLKSFFGQSAIMAPDLPVAPDSAATFIEKLLKRPSFSGLIGSSLGGFYATLFSELFRIPAVLINPSVHPDRTLAPYVGSNRFWCSGEAFEWKREYLDQLRAMKSGGGRCSTMKLVLLQTADEVLDYRIAEAAYSGCEIVVEPGGNHRFENLQEYLGLIEDFFNRL
ncbi:MAG TPA: hypothetical protein ENL04_00815 [Sulfuricurvum sp.]|nr:hypothetical protein [Sulfuricurvum sp.]